jgi:hypothetical protein
MDALIHLASVAMDRDYRAEGLTLERMGLEGIERAAFDRLIESGYPD